MNEFTTPFILRREILVRFVGMLFAVAFTLSQGCGGGSGGLEVMKR